MKVRRIGREGRRGATLIEALIAIGVLGIGTAGVASLITTVTRANRTMSFQNKSLDVLASFSAQVRDATCDVQPQAPGFDPATTDDGLEPTGGLVTAPIAGSGITIVGDLTPSNPTAPFHTTPPMNVTYQSRLCPDTAGVCPADGPPYLDVQVIIRVIPNSDPVCDRAGPTSNLCVREFSVKKLCTLRGDQVGRGEFGYL